MAKKPTYEELEQKVKEFENEALERKRAEEALRPSEKTFRSIIENLPMDKQTEDNLRRSEKKFRYLFESMTQGVFSQNADGSFLHINDAALEMFGLTRDQFMGRDPYDPRWKVIRKDNSLITPEEYPSLVTLRTGETIIDYEMGIFSPKKKDYTWLSVSSIPRFRENEKKPYQAFVTIHDITKRKQAEEALRESEEKYRSLLEDVVDSSNVGIFILDSDFRVVWVNQSLNLYFGFQGEEIVGRDKRQLILKQIMHKFEDPGGFTEKVLATYDDNTYVENFECHVLPVDKREDRWLEHWSKPIRSGLYSGGRVELYYDITDRKRAEEALRKSETWLQSIYNSLEEAVFVITPHRTILNINDAAQRMFGYSQEELTGQSSEVLHLDQAHYMEFGRRMKVAFDKGESANFEFEVKRKNGEIFPTENAVSLLKNGQGKSLGIVSVVRDITEKRKLENQLMQAKKMEAIATLAGGIAHEFNNALMGIMGNIELFKMDLPEDDWTAKYFEAMKDSGHRMSRLTDQLLAYSEGGKYNPKNLKLDDFVIETVRILQHDLGPTVRLETHFKKDISYVKADHSQMQMVLSAILANSNEAIEDEGIIKIAVGNEDLNEDFTEKHPGIKPGSYVCVTVEDEGKGMNEEEREKIFEPFFTTKFQGRGMGMAAVYGIVKNHDGWIYVDSELGQGTVVRIYLPAVEAEEEVKKEVVLRPTVELATGEGTILVIEDEEPLVKLFRKVLERLGYRVLEARTGKEAVEFAKTFDGQIDLALLDIKLPDMEGGRVYPLIMGARPDLKVIVCSGYSIHGPAQDILDAGAEGFIQKPFLIAPFAEKLKEVLEGK